MGGCLMRFIDEFGLLHLDGGRRIVSVFVKKISQSEVIRVYNSHEL